MRHPTSRLLVFAFLSLIVANEASFVPSELSISTNFDRRIFNSFEYNEDADLTARQLLAKYGYRSETHRVTTKTGYILEMHRITGPRSNGNPAGKEPVLLVHGLLSSSVDWIITGPEKGFGYILADEGYDVWMGNIRGNTYSRKHTKYSVLDKEYWQFSWHEIGIEDIPAMVDYVLEKTNRQKLMYAGHSQGTTDFWVMTSQLPEYNNKVKAMFALAPVAYLTHIRSPFYHILAEVGGTVDAVMAGLGYYEFEPTSELVKKITSIACDHEAPTQPLCLNIIFLIAGYGSDQLNKTMLPAILGHVPAGASVKQVTHYSQLIKSQKFHQYDFGLFGNLKRYKSFKPPLYPLSKVKVPVYLHYSSNDWFSDPKDVDQLYQELGNPISKIRVPHTMFSHLDFIWANDAKQLLYDKVIALMDQYKD